MTPSILLFVVRNFIRNLSFSAITLSSLVVGITTTLLFFVWVNYEFTYNKSVVHHERIFALLLNNKVEGEIHTEEGTSIPLMDFLENEVAEVEAVTRIENKNGMLANGEISIHKTGVYGDSSFFTVHPPDQLQGNAVRALVNNRSIAISKTLASELFGDDDALGKTILIDRKTEYSISLVFSPYPQNSSFRYINFVLPFSARPKDANDWVNHDIKLFDPSTRERVEKRIDQKIAQLSPQEDTQSFLFAVTDWRLHWSFENGKVSGGRIVYVIIFSISGLFVLLMACINYMNISTAQATRRMREIGVRKMTGATQTNLIRQFMFESLILTSAAALLSILMAYLLLPLFNELVGVQLVLSFADPCLPSVC
jgi:putative ABC transport system permease protein